MSLNGYLLLLLGIQRVGFFKSVGKDILLMHAFLSCLLSLFFSLRSFPFFVFFQFPLFLLPLSSSHFSSGYFSYLYWVNLMVFLYFTYRASPTVFLSVVDTPSNLSTNPLIVHQLPLLDMPSALSSSTICYMTNFPFVGLGMSLFPFFE